MPAQVVHSMVPPFLGYVRLKNIWLIALQTSEKQFFYSAEEGCYKAKEESILLTVHLATIERLQVS